MNNLEKQEVNFCTRCGSKSLEIKKSGWEDETDDTSNYIQPVLCYQYSEDDECELSDFLNECNCQSCGKTFYTSKKD